MQKNKYKNKECYYDNIKFQSELERDFYIYLLRSNSKQNIIIQPKYILQSKFTDNEGKKIREIAYSADFKVDNIIYDVKGMLTQQGEMRIKMLKYALKDTDLILKAICKAPVYSGFEWIDIYDLKKLRKLRKKNKV